jgi:hypothetical protein
MGNPIIAGLASSGSWASFVAEDGAVAQKLLDDTVGFGAAASMAVAALPGLR